MTAPTPAEVEALARALCRVQGVDPDAPLMLFYGEPVGQIWRKFYQEARTILEQKAAAAMVEKENGHV